jgi:FKBP-type peptidyl-prolyl cis-trans isomerase 2
MTIKKGDNVSVDYEGKFEDGTVFDSSTHGDHSHPLEFEVGAGKVIKGFDSAVIGMKKDEEKNFEIKPEDAYGEPRPELKKDFPRTILPADQEPKAGMTMAMGTPDGHQIPVKILEVTTDKIVVDLNHPLAGKKLLFKIKIIKVN